MSSDHAAKKQGSGSLYTYTIHDLPNELHKQIRAQIGPREASALVRTCFRFNKFYGDPTYWRNRYNTEVAWLNGAKPNSYEKSDDPAVNWLAECDTSLYFDHSKCHVYGVTLDPPTFSSEKYKSYYRFFMGWIFQVRVIGHRNAQNATDRRTWALMAGEITPNGNIYYDPNIYTWIKPSRSPVSTSSSQSKATGNTTGIAEWHDYSTGLVFDEQHSTKMNIKLAISGADDHVVLINFNTETGKCTRDDDFSFKEILPIGFEFRTEKYEGQLQAFTYLYPFVGLGTFFLRDGRNMKRSWLFGKDQAGWKCLGNHDPSLNAEQGVWSCDIAVPRWQRKGNELYLQMPYTIDDKENKESIITVDEIFVRDTSPGNLPFLTVSDTPMFQASINLDHLGFRLDYHNLSMKCLILRNERRRREAGLCLQKPRNGKLVFTDVSNSQFLGPTHHLDRRGGIFFLDQRDTLCYVEERTMTDLQGNLEDLGTKLRHPHEQDTSIESPTPWPEHPSWKISTDRERIILFSAASADGKMVFKVFDFKHNSKHVAKLVKQD